MVVSGEQRLSAIVEGLANVGLAGLSLRYISKNSRTKSRSTHPIEEDGCLAEDMPRFNELSATDRKGLIAVVHLEHAGLMLRKLDIEFISYLLHAWTNDGKGSRVEERSDGDIVLLDLGSEEADAASHFVYSAYFTDEGTLEGVHFGVELNTYQHRSRRRRSDTHVFKLDIAKFSKFGNRIVCYFCWDIQLHKAHLLRPYVPPFQHATRLKMTSWTYGTDWGSRQPWLEMIRVWQRKSQFHRQTCSAPNVNLDSATLSCGPHHLR